MKWLRAKMRPEILTLGALWTIVGFIGSLGMNFYFHRALFEFVPFFRSMRVAARWAMICYLGLALLAGLGASRLAGKLARSSRQVMRRPMVYAFIVLAFLFEQRVAPLHLEKGQPDPDQLTLRLKATPMRGGLVELPAGGPQGNYLYVLRAADHARPLITATNSFVPLLEREIESVTQQSEIPDRFLDLLESIPTSYVVVHYDNLSYENRWALQPLLSRGMAAGRLRFIKSYTDQGRADLYAVTKVEPEAQSEEPVPVLISP